MSEDSPEDPEFQVSLSAFTSWQSCEQKYFYSYVRKLRPKDQYTAPTLGRILHSYLEHYYEYVKAKYKPEDAHLASQLRTSEEYMPEIRGYVNVSLATGNEQLAHELNSLPSQAGRITDRYFATRGRSDAEQYEVMYTEARLNLRIADGIRSTGVADLVTRDLETGRINLWEHKSTQNVPQDSVRLTDFQTLLYATKIRLQTGLVIDSVVWNYLRTKEPTVPEVLKNGKLTSRRDLDTTWPVYSEALADTGEDPNAAEYTEIRSKLIPRELTTFFPRYERVIVVQEDVLMHDYIEEAKRMRRARADWEHGVSRPIRTIDRGCAICEYRKICEAVVTGGDEDDVIRIRFTEGRGKDSREVVV